MLQYMSVHYIILSIGASAFAGLLQERLQGEQMLIIETKL